MALYKVCILLISCGPVKMDAVECVFIQPGVGANFDVQLLGLKQWKSFQNGSIMFVWLHILFSKKARHLIEVEVCLFWPK